MTDSGTRESDPAAETEDPFKMLIGSNQAYYMDVIQKAAGKKRLPFNISAFMFGPLWFAYRKMYWAAWWYALLQSILINAFFWIGVLGAMMPDAHPPIRAELIVCFIVSYIGGAVANKMYLSYLQKHFAVVKNLTTPEAFQQGIIKKYIRKNGGTSLFNALLTSMNFIMMIGGLWLLVGIISVLIGLAEQTPAGEIDNFLRGISEIYKNIK